MDGFQKAVIAAGVILLIISLVFIGVIMKQAIRSEAWPPILGDCPDYWVDLGTDGSACYNAKKLGSCNIPTNDNNNTMDFTQDAYTGSDGACNKKRWAQKCSKNAEVGPIAWDGITYGVADPCEEDTSD
jgi:hypothetical protein